MTISLIHVNPNTGLSAAISATGGVSVGGYVNHSWRGVGACATQGLFTMIRFYMHFLTALLLKRRRIQAQS
ncbi:DUF1028 domain-containing protein [Vibrio fortis]